MAATVLAGAFGAHGLEGQIPEKAMEWWEVGIRYQAWHGLALLLLGLLRYKGASHRSVTIVGCLFLSGIFLFSGSLYALALGAPGWFGAITPLGGTAWILAWTILGITCFSSSS